MNKLIKLVLVILLSETSGGNTQVASPVTKDLALTMSTPKLSVADGAKYRDINILGRTVTPKGQSVLSMALAMSMLFFGYEFARNTSLAIFTSHKTGFSGPSAYPLAMASATPFSLCMLMGYSRELSSKGPRIALRHTTLFCACAFFLSAILITMMEESRIIFRFGGSIISLEQMIVFVFFVFQNSYAHLLCTQHWSFIGSVLTPAQGASWFAAIGGISSLTSTVAGGAVSRLVGYVSLPLLFGGATSLSLLASLLFADNAYSIGEECGFNPSSEQGKTTKAKNESKASHSDDRNMVKKTSDLFARVPTLKLLFFEVINFQSLSALLNIAFVTKLRVAVPDDVLRASWTGNFFALVNAVSGCMQFLVVPWLLKRADTGLVCRVMSLIVLCFVIFQCLQRDPSLYLVGGTFFLAKALDYSLRGVINEMVYVPLDFESRYLGKEVVGVFGNRIGKSGVALLLSGLTPLFGDFSLQGLSCLSTFFAASWSMCAFCLSRVIPNARSQKVSNKIQDDNTDKND